MRVGCGSPVRRRDVELKGRVLHSGQALLLWGLTVRCDPQAFSELQVKMIDTQQKVKMADLQIDQLTRVQKHAKLTHAEIATLPDNTRLYEGVGRM